MSLKKKVIVIGAGPGDPELLTLKGLKYLQVADVVIYDKLTAQAVVYARENSVKYMLSSDEDEIEVIRRYLRGYDVIVRLKNGDPYVFGRGPQLCYNMIAEGIQCEVIPGVSAVNSVPAYAGIPLTSNGFSDMVTVVSGVTEGGKLFDFSKVPDKGTLVVLMAGKRLEEGSKGLMSRRSPLDDVAVVEHGTYVDQRVSVMKLKDLVNVRPSSPSMLILGDVVKMRSLLWKFS
nr:uroporphyrinogen-III C-methyltransferase [Sulfolobus acidocaldarius]